MRTLKNTLVISTLLLFGTLSGQGQGVVPLMMRDAERVQQAEAFADRWMQQLSPRQRAAQLIMPMTFPKTDKAGLENWRRQVKEAEFGGVLWQKGAPEDVVRLANYMRKEARIPMLVTMDGEWGLSMRFSGTVKWPRNIVLGAANDISLAYAYGRATAEEAKRMGIHVDFAPVLDVNSNPLNPVIGTRSYGSDPALVSRLGLAYSLGMESAGVLSTAKHFPGHGDTATDSHLTLPVINRFRDQLESVELAPFRDYVSQGFGGIMVGHLSIPALHTGTKATSAIPYVVTTLLQEELGFRGLIFTDGLGMKGIQDGAGADGVAVTTFLAGADILLAPVDPFEALDEIVAAVEAGKIAQAEIDRRCRKVLIWKHLLGADSRQPIPTKSLSRDLNAPGSIRLCQEIYDRAITLVKNEGNVLPLTSGTPTYITYTKDAALPKGVDSNAPLILRVTESAAECTPELVHLLRESRSVLIFHTSPYVALKYADALEAADAVVFAYDASEYADQAVKKVLSGKLPFQGTLPVDLAPYYRAGTGLTNY